jgi:hypothetical protein
VLSLSKLVICLTISAMPLWDLREKYEDNLASVGSASPSLEEAFARFT